MKIYSKRQAFRFYFFLAVLIFGPSIIRGQETSGDLLKMIKYWPDFKYKYNVIYPYQKRTYQVTFTLVGDRFSFARKWQSEESSDSNDKVDIANGSELSQLNFTSFDGKTYHVYHGDSDILTLGSDYEKMRQYIISEWKDNLLTNPWWVLTYLPNRFQLNFSRSDGFNLPKIFFDPESDFSYVLNSKRNGLHVVYRKAGLEKFPDTGFPIFKKIEWDQTDGLPKKITVPYPGHSQDIYWTMSDTFRPFGDDSDFIIPRKISSNGNCQFDYILQIEEGSFELLKASSVRDDEFKFPASFARVIDDLDLGVPVEKPN